MQGHSLQLQNPRNLPLPRAPTRVRPTESHPKYLSATAWTPPRAPISPPSCLKTETSPSPHCPYPPGVLPSRKQAKSRGGRRTSRTERGTRAEFSSPVPASRMSTFRSGPLLKADDTNFSMERDEKVGFENRQRLTADSFLSTPTVGGGTYPFPQGCGEGKRGGICSTLSEIREVKLR